LKKRSILLWLTFLITLGSGIINVISVINPALPERRSLLREVFPLEFLHISRSLTLLVGFALIISSINVYKRKKRALQIVMILAGLSVVFHLTKGLDYEEATLSLALIAVLLFSKREFRVKSSLPDMRLGLVNFLVAGLVALGYGILGFWLLDKRQFGIDFTMIDSLRKTLKFLAWAGDPQLVPRTRYARWFLDSLYLISITAVVYSIYAVFRPTIFKFRTLPRERAAASEIIKRFGRSSMEYFKLWPDKSFFFSPSGKSFLAYKVGGNFALALADPVGPENEIREIIGGFMDFCGERGWKITFHQSLPDFLPLYRSLGFRKLKIGEEGIVDLAGFSLDGKRNKHLRHYVNQFDKEGIHTDYHEPPISDDVLGAVREVSEDWLRIPGRREKGFTQGVFGKAYIRGTPLFVVSEASGNILAFANIVPSFHSGEATIDLMRHRIGAPAGIMDFLFVKLFALLRERGFARFSLGLAPMTGFADDEEAAPEERAVQFFLQRMTFLFSYQGLYNYKKKFATSWEPRYEIYRNVFDLPRLAVALGKVSGVGNPQSEIDAGE
jgi:phosphatidylglycerol lysyltransferase